MDSKVRKKLAIFVKDLSSYRGRHTEFVSVYIPEGYELTKIINHLSQEQGTATNIKDKKTRDSVISALEKVIRHLRTFKQTPENGLAVFAGNVSEKDNVNDVKVFSIEPPEPLNVRLYRCDQTFVVDILRDMMEDKETYGLIVLDRRDGILGTLRGTRITKLVEFTSDVPGKTTKGGQSQQRYARLRDEAAREFYKRIANAANKEFLEMEELKGIIVGGPGPTKEDFLKEELLNHTLAKKVLAVKDLSYTGEFGLNELVDKSQDDLAQEAVIEEKNLVTEFFETYAKNEKLVVVGEKDVVNAINLGAVAKILVSEEVEDKKIEELEKLAESMGTEVKIISNESREGEQLSQVGKGIVGILRYALS